MYKRQAQVRIEPSTGATDVYQWGEQSLEFHRCKRCGCTTHWVPVDRKVERIAVNARLMEPEVLRPLRIRKFDGALTGKYMR